MESTQTLPDQTETDGDEPKLQHAFDPEDVARAQITDEMVQAVCGRWFRPRHFDPNSDLPKCSGCLGVLNARSN